MPRHITRLLALCLAVAAGSPAPGMAQGLDPALLLETHGALDELTSILALGSDFYDFQRP